MSLRNRVIVVTVSGICVLVWALTSGCSSSDAPAGQPGDAGAGSDGSSSAPSCDAALGDALPDGRIGGGGGVVNLDCGTKLPGKGPDGGGCTTNAQCSAGLECCFPMKRCIDPATETCG